MTPIFKQSEVICIVSRLIDDCYRRRQDYVGRLDLINAFMDDHQSGRLAHSAWERYEHKNRYEPKLQWRFQTKTELVGNMIDWFSAQYGRGDIELTSRFERVKIGKYWAYKPVRSATGGPTGFVYRKFTPQQVDAMTALLHHNGFTDVTYDTRGNASEPFTFTPPRCLATGLVRLAFIQGLGWHVDLMAGRYGTGTWEGLVSHFEWLGTLVDDLARF